MKSLKPQILWACAVLTLGAASAEAQFGTRCCNVLSNPSGTVSANIGDTVLYDLELDPGKCQLGEVDWVLESLDTGIQVSAVPNTDQLVSVAVGAGAPEASRWRAQARNYDPVTGDTICVGRGFFNLDVSDPTVLPSDLDVEQVVPPGAINMIDGVPFNVTSLIRNIGDGPAGATSTRLFLDGVAGEAQPCPALGLQATCPQTWSVTLDAGMHEIKICADTFGQEAESDESNNCRLSPVSVGEARPADLVVEQLIVNPTVLAETGQGHVQMVIKNRGAGLSGDFQVAISGAGTFAPSSARISGLAAGATHTESFVWTAGTPVENGSITGAVDTLNEVPESVETNNVRSTAVTVLPLLPDLTFWVSDITISPASPSAGDTLEIRAEMRNVGNVGIPGPVTLDIDAFGFNTRVDCYSIAIGGSCVAYAHRTVPSDGSFTIYARADLDNQLTEIDELNNQRSLSFNVGPQVTCQGTWALTQTSPPPAPGESPSVVESQGSVLDGPNGQPCFVYFASNSPNGCWQTYGVDGLQATWSNDGLCPTSVEVVKPNAAPGETDRWTYSVQIQP